jgi:hypothetical protein
VAATKAAKAEAAACCIRRVLVDSSAAAQPLKRLAFAFSGHHGRRRAGPKSGDLGKTPRRQRSHFDSRFLRFSLGAVALSNQPSAKPSSLEVRVIWV